MAAGGSNEINLTPFIDLFSVLICFLLMTAAWIQLEVMPTNMEKATAADTPASDTPPPPPDEKKVKLYVDMAANQVVLREDDQGLVIPNTADGFSVEAVKNKLTAWKTKFPDRNDVILNTEAQVQYGQMIKMYDTLLSAEFAEVGINPQ